MITNNLSTGYGTQFVFFKDHVTCQIQATPGVPHVTSGYDSEGRDTSMDSNRQFPPLLSYTSCLALHRQPARSTRHLAFGWPVWLVATMAKGHLPPQQRCRCVEPLSSRAPPVSASYSSSITSKKHCVPMACITL